MAHLVNIDYCGIFVTDASTSNEIVMADTARYPGSNSTLNFDNVKGKLRIELSGSFQERPITTSVPQARLDVYVNENNRGSLLRWIRSSFSLSLIAPKSLPTAPDPRPFVGGSTAIPLTGVPSSQFLTEFGRAEIPRWVLEGTNIRTFIDVETDPAHGTQYHIGLRLKRTSQLAATTTQLALYSSTGSLTLDKEAIGILYSYIHGLP